MYRPQDQVPQINADDYAMTVDGHNNTNAVNQLLSKGHQSNSKTVLPSTSRATKSNKSPGYRPILKDLTSKSTQKHQSRLDEIIEEDTSAMLDEEMPQFKLVPILPPQKTNKVHIGSKIKA